MTTAERQPAGGVPVPSLVRWGLSPDADLVYRALAMLGPRTIDWLAHDLGLPAQRLRAAIDDLASAGAITSTPSRAVAGTRWYAAPVAELTNRLRGRSHHAVRPQPDEAARVHHTLLDAHPHDHHARHMGVAAVRHRLGQLVAAERHEHLVLNPEPAFAAATVEAARPLVRRLAANGVTVRECGVPGPDADIAVAPNSGYRELSHVPIKLMVFDRRVALLPVDPADVAAGALEIDQPAVVVAMVALFEQLWSTGREPRKTGGGLIVFTSREKDIVGLLARGCTDASVAQRLSLSQRTIAYTMRTLMDRVGAENRFQLGLILGAAKLAAPPTNASKET